MNFIYAKIIAITVCIFVSVGIPQPLKWSLIFPSCLRINCTTHTLCEAPSSSPSGGEKLADLCSQPLGKKQESPNIFAATQMLGVLDKQPAL